ncbi:MAG: replication protein [Candidatus Thorarchaeota archaeon]|jgi:DNA-binding transcriptional ArsR family regulator
MSAAISFQEIPLSEKRIRVQSTPDGFAMIPHSLTRKMMKWSGSQSGVFLYIWERTVSFRKLSQEISVEEIMRATDSSRSTVQRSTQSLKENGFLSIQEKPSGKNIYGIPEKLLEEHGCLVEIQPVKNDRSSRAREGSKILDLDLKENYPKTPIVKSKSNRPSRKGQGIVKIPEHPVAEKLRYCGVYPKTIVKLFGSYDPEDMWQTIKQFEFDMAQSNNVEDMAATLVWRIKNGVTTWESEESLANSGDLSAESWKAYLEPELLEEYQELVYKQYDHPEGSPGYVLPVLMEFKQRAGISLTQAMEVVDVRGASRDELFEWHSEVE